MRKWQKSLRAAAAWLAIQLIPNCLFMPDSGCGKLVKEDIRLGYRSFDMAPMFEALQKGEKVSEVDLAKVEKVIADGTMPLAKYYLVHWGSSVSDTEKQMALAWV